MSWEPSEDLSSVLRRQPNSSTQATPESQPVRGTPPMPLPQTGRYQNPAPTFQYSPTMPPLSGTPPFFSPSAQMSTTQPWFLPCSCRNVTDMAPVLSALQSADNKTVPYVKSISNSSNFTIGNIIHWHVDRPSNMEGKSQAFINYCKKEDDCFVETGAYAEAISVLNEHDVVNILGGSGEGKTALLKHLTLEMERREFIPLEITRPEEIEENYSDGTKFLFVCDDPFGGPYLQQDSVNSWVRMGRALEKYLSKGLIKIAFASRKTIWADCDKCLSDFKLFRHTVEVSSSRLTCEEKKLLVRKHFRSRHTALCEKDVITLAELETPIAFPYCCKLAGEFEFRNMSFDRILNIFSRPFVLLEKELRKLLENTPWKYSVLVLIMLSGGGLPCDQLNASDATPEMEQMVNCVLDSCGIADSQRPYGQLKKCAESLVGTYLNRGQNSAQENIYCFSHDSIFEAVTVEYGEDHVSDFLRFSRSAWIIAVCRPQDYERIYNEPVIRVHKRQYTKVAEKFTRQVLLGSSRVSNVFRSPFLKDKAFQKAWIECVESSGRRGEFLKLEDWGGKSVLYCAAFAGAGEIVQYLLQHGVNSRKIDNQHYHPVVGAARGGNVEELSLLLESSTPKDVVKIAVEDACYTGCWETVNHLFLVDTETCVEVVGKALFAAMMKGHQHLVSFLLNYSPSPEDIGKALVEACKRGHHAIIQHLFSLKKDICCAKIDEGFIAAASYGHFEVLNFLMQKTVSMEAVECALASAAKATRHDVVRFIMSRDFPEKVDVSRSLVTSASLGDIRTISFLLEYSPSHNALKKAINGACQFDHIHVVKLLHTFIGEQTDDCLVFMFHSAAGGNAMQVIRFLETLNPPDAAIEQAVISAARYGNLQMIEYLISLSQDITMTALETAYLEAARKGQCKIVKFLLEKGVDINVKDKNGKTAVDLASEYWKTNVVNILLSKGAREPPDS